MDNPSPLLPRVTISFCTQCKWMLRAAYFAQELLSTFSTSLGEVALQPSTGGTFVVTLYTAAGKSEGSAENEPVTIQKNVLWDRKTEGGFPETKELKRRVRDIIDPNRDLGHVDGKKSTTSTHTAPQPTTSITNDDKYLSQPPIPRALSNLQGDKSTLAERKFTPMDLDSSSRPVSSAGNHGEVLNSRGKIQVGDEGMGFCRPGEDCEDCG